jgi:hypothetical protein
MTGSKFHDRISGDIRKSDKPAGRWLWPNGARPRGSVLYVQLGAPKTVWSVSRQRLVERNPVSAIAGGLTHAGGPAKGPQAQS